MDPKTRMLRLVQRDTTEPELSFFTHEVSGSLYGAWYRLLSTSTVEVVGIGFIRTVPCVGVNPEAAARWCLEDFVMEHLRIRRTLPTLSEVKLALQNLYGAPSQR